MESELTVPNNLNAQYNKQNKYIKFINNQRRKPKKKKKGK